LAALALEALGLGALKKTRAEGRVDRAIALLSILNPVYLLLRFSALK
jgi:hypothetical protein